MRERKLIENFSILSNNHIVSIFSICIILIVFISPCISVISSSEQLPRRGQEIIDAFDNEIASTTLVFPEKGSDSSLEVTIPVKAKIENATLDIEGRSFNVQVNEIVENFKNTNNKRAWDVDNFNQLPTNSPPSSFMVTPYNTNDYTDVQADDSEDKTTIGGADAAGYPVQLYEFNLSSYTVLGFDVFWVGHYESWNMGNGDGMNVTIWNATSNSWEIIGGHYTPPGSSQTNDVHHAEHFQTGIPYYINSTSKLLYIMVYGPFGIGYSYCTLYTDYISINVSTNSYPSFPKNVYLDIGCDEDNDWEYVGELRSKETFSGRDFIDELQQHINAQSHNNDEAYIPFKIGTSQSGKLYISNLSITYQLYSDPPINSIDIPDISFSEDSGWFESDIDLRDYFTEGDDAYENLTFNLNGNTPHIFGFVVSGYKMNFTSSKDFFGYTEFNVSCRDRGLDGVTSADDHIIYSNNFMVTVLPTDDPPVITHVDNRVVVDNKVILHAMEDTYLNFTISAHDIDGDSIVISDDLPTSLVVPGTCKISFLPLQEDVGFFNFTITAKERNTSGLFDYVNIAIEVNNTNDPPSMTDMVDLSVKEDRWLNVTVLAEDIDLRYDKGEYLKYSTNFSDSGISSERWSFNEDTGYFTFHPDNSLVGIYQVRFSIEDSSGMEDSRCVIIEVLNINDPPVLGEIEVMINDADITTEETENLTVGFKTQPATDPDLMHGDILEYSWDFDLSNGIGSDGIGLMVYHDYSESGNYTVTLTVTDSLGESSSITKDIHVLAVPEKDNGGNDTDNNGTIDEDNDKEGFFDSYWYIFLILGVILIVIAISIVSAVLIKRNKHENHHSNGDEIEQQ